MEDSAQDVILKTDQPVRTQFLIFTLFGDYLLNRQGGIWTSSVLTLMELLGVSNRAVRSALFRMTRKGWIRSKRHGRRSEYSPTERGRTLLTRGQSRIFEEVITDWDGQWHLVVYSLPEEKRNLRNTLRTQLSWLGFGQLSPGAWISPHNRADTLEAMLKEINATEFVDMFSGSYLGPFNAQDLIARSWDLEALGAQYQEFIAKYKLEYEDSLSRANGRNELSPEQCFVRRFWLTHDFQSFPLRDPNLPIDLLPPEWVGTRARLLFDDYHQFLGKSADQFVDEIIAQENNAES